MKLSYTKVAETASFELPAQDVHLNGPNEARIIASSELEVADELTSPSDLFKRQDILYNDFTCFVAGGKKPCDGKICIVPGVDTCCNQGSGLHCKPSQFCVPGQCCNKNTEAACGRLCIPKGQQCCGGMVCAAGFSCVDQRCVKVVVVVPSSQPQPPAPSSKAPAPLPSTSIPPPPPTTTYRLPPPTSTYIPPPPTSTYIPPPPTSTYIPSSSSSSSTSSTSSTSSSRFSSTSTVSTSSSLGTTSSATRDVGPTTTNENSETTDGPLSALSLSQSLFEMLQTAIPSEALNNAESACFVSPEYASYYTTPDWYRSIPSGAQSFYASVHAATSQTGICTATAVAAAGGSDSNPEGHHLSAGATAGAVVGGLAGAAALAGLGIYAYKVGLFSGLVGAKAVGAGTAVGTSGAAAGSSAAAATGPPAGASAPATGQVPIVPVVAAGGYRRASDEEKSWTPSPPNTAAAWSQQSNQSYSGQQTYPGQASYTVPQAYPGQQTYPDHQVSPGAYSAHQNIQAHQNGQWQGNR